MRAHVWIGIVLLVFGVAVLLVPRTESTSVSVGGVSVGIETQKKENTSPLVGGAMLFAGFGLMIGGKRFASLRKEGNPQ